MAARGLAFAASARRLACSSLRRFFFLGIWGSKVSLEICYKVAYSMSINNILEALVQSQESAYTDGMSWKDFLEDHEADQLREAEAAKAEAVAGYNAVRRLLKARCDARMRRAKEARAPIQTDSDDGKER